MNVIETHIDKHGSRTDVFTPEAFSELDIADMPVPECEHTVIEDIGCMVRSLNSNDTAPCSVVVERTHLCNDTPFYTLKVEFSNSMPITLQRDIGDIWSLQEIRHNEDHTIAKVRYKGSNF